MAEIGSSLPIKTLNVPGVDGANVTIGVLDAAGALISPAIEGGNLATIAAVDFATSAKQDSALTLLGTIDADTSVLAATDFATEAKQDSAIAILTTIDADTGVLAAVDFALAAKQDAQTALLTTIDADTGSIDAKLPATLGSQLSAASLSVVLASDHVSIPVHITASSAETGLASHYTEVVASAQPYTTPHTYAVGAGAILKLDGVWATASGRIKVEVYIGPDGSETLRTTGFNSTANPNVDIPMYDYKVLDTESVKVIVYNLENQAQSVYSTIIGNLT